MDLRKLHYRLKNGIDSLGKSLQERSYPESVVHCFQEIFKEVGVESVPNSLQEDFQQLKTKLSADSKEGANPLEDLSREDAQAIVHKIVGLLCKIRSTKQTATASPKVGDFDSLPGNAEPVLPSEAKVEVPAL